jgi:hypothetical protein
VAGLVNISFASRIPVPAAPSKSASIGFTEGPPAISEIQLATTKRIGPTAGRMRDGMDGNPHFARRTIIGETMPIKRSRNAFVTDEAFSAGDESGSPGTTAGAGIGAALVPVLATAVAALLVAMIAVVSTGPFVWNGLADGRKRQQGDGGNNQDGFGFHRLLVTVGRDIGTNYPRCHVIQQLLVGVNPGF